MFKTICIYFVLLCICILPSTAQEELGLHFMPRAWQSSQTNPAFLMERKIAIALPSFGVSASNSGFSFSDLVHETLDGDSLSIDVNKVLALVDADNSFRVRTNVDLLHLALRFGKLQVSLSGQARAHGLFAYPSSLLDLVWNGNAQFVGQKIDIAPQLALMAYQEFGVGGAYHLNENIQVGLRFKYLMGLANVSTERSAITLSTDDAYYQTTFQSDVLIHTSMISTDLPNEFSPEFKFEPFSGNTGFGIDLGAVYSPNERFHFSVSALNVEGNIHWTEQGAKLESEGTYTFDGIDAKGILTGEEVNFQGIADTLLDIFEFTESETTFKTKLPRQFYLSSTFQPLPSLRLGALLFHERFQNQSFQALTLSASKDLGKVFTGGITYSMRKRSYENIGVNLLVKGGPFVFFLYSDNVLGFIAPQAARSIHLRWGLNIAI